jgi:outer membrane protein assembly factor BamD
MRWHPVCAQLDAIVHAVTLREEMKYRLRFILLLVAASLAFPERSPAPVVFKAGKGMKYHPPGEEEINGTAQELAAIAETAAKEGNSNRAIKAYSKILRRYPRDVRAPDASFRIGELQEQRQNYIRAAGAYRYLVEKYPQSPHFDEAIEGQFRIGEMFLAGKKRKILGVTISNMLDAAVEIFASVVRTAPYGKYTARAQFAIGLAREKQGQAEAAITAYQAVIDKFPNEPVAADAQYQIGYLWYSSARAGAKDPNAVSRATTGFQDFLFRYPHSEKAPQARENLARLENKATSDSFGVAKFYDKRGNYRAAVIYYNDVIRQQPGSTQGDEAKRRIDQLRSKIGDAAVKEIEVAANAPKKKPRNMANAGESREGSPAMRASPTDVAPLPPPEADVSLPPPASLAPDTTTAPAVSPTPTESPTPASTASPTP